MGYLAIKAAEKLKDGKLGGIGMVSPLFGAINSRQNKKRQGKNAAAAAAGGAASTSGSDYSTKVISPTMMNAGGGVSKAGRGDGICRSGKTKGRMV
jgi:hypothetical protein|tara:strand:+ start:260 stop:547 length:288 start_codon:yes stop_codon:yes gene_type:complete